MDHDALEELPVVESEHGGKFLGLVTRRAIAQTFNRVSVSLSTLGPPGNFLSFGAPPQRDPPNCRLSSGRVLRRS